MLESTGDARTHNRYPPSPEEKTAKFVLILLPVYSAGVPDGGKAKGNRDISLERGSCTVISYNIG